MVDGEQSRIFKTCSRKWILTETEYSVLVLRNLPGLPKQAQKSVQLFKVLAIRCLY